MRLLLVEDDQNLGLSLQQALRQEGHAANWIPDAKSARGALETEQYDLLIVDLALPDSTGLDLIQDVRKTKSSNALILALGDRLDKNARINALDAGADDYLLKPFGLDELRANIRALVRRQAGRPASELIYGPIRLDPASRNVSVHGNAVDLTPREFAMLEVLLENAGRIVSKSRLEETLYAWDEEVESNAVEVHVHRLRKKLGADFIRTVRGVGYAISGEAVAQPTGEVQPAGHPLPQHGPGEFEPLLGMLDQIFKRLQQDLDHERNVCTETAQILRRPLNAIKLQAELALRSDDPKIRALTLNNILRATDRAQSLLDSLAAVIGLERDKVPTLNRQVALCEICEQVTAELEPGRRPRARHCLESCHAMRGDHLGRRYSLVGSDPTAFGVRPDEKPVQTPHRNQRDAARRFCPPRRARSRRRARDQRSRAATRARAPARGQRSTAAVTLESRTPFRFDVGRAYC